MPLELRKSSIPAIGLAGIVIVSICRRMVRDTIDVVSTPLRLAFDVLLFAAGTGMFEWLRTLLPLVLARTPDLVPTALDR